ncbi:MAG: hypothetical protein CMN31_18585 [Sandaracinus sp.]|nr:hypothetical protein [Sandaracinus sp.]
MYGPRGVEGDLPKVELDVEFNFFSVSPPIRADTTRDGDPSRDVARGPELVRPMAPARELLELGA